MKSSDKQQSSVTDIEDERFKKEVKKLSAKTRNLLGKYDLAIFLIYAALYGLSDKVKIVLEILISISDENGDWACSQKELLQNYGLTARTIQKHTKENLSEGEKSKARRLFDSTIKELDRADVLDFTFRLIKLNPIVRSRKSKITSYKNQTGTDKTSGNCLGYLEFVKEVRKRVSNDPKNRTAETRLNCYRHHTRKLIAERLEGQPIALAKKATENIELVRKDRLKKALKNYLQERGINPDQTDHVLDVVLSEIEKLQSTENNQTKHNVNFTGGGCKLDNIYIKSQAGSDLGDSLNDDDLSAARGVSFVPPLESFLVSPLDTDSVNMDELSSPFTLVNFSGLSDEEIENLPAYSCSVVHFQASVHRFLAAGFDTAGFSLVGYKRGIDSEYLKDGNGAYQKFHATFKGADRQSGYAYTEQPLNWLTDNIHYFVKKLYSDNLALMVRLKDSSGQRELVQVDDVDGDLLSYLRPYCFDVLETSPGNFQCLMSVDFGHGTHVREALRGKFDAGATGAIKMPGCPNNKPNRILPDGTLFRVRSVGGIDFNKPSTERLIDAGLWASVKSDDVVEPEVNAEIVKNLPFCQVVKNPAGFSGVLPVYDQNKGNTLRADGSIDVSAYDFGYTLHALKIGCGDSEILQVLARERREDKVNFDDYARRTLAEAKKRLGRS